MKRILWLLLILFITIGYLNIKKKLRIDKFVFVFLTLLSFYHSLILQIDYIIIQGATPAGPVFKHKLFLTDGWNCAFNGICVYIFRLNTTKPLPEEGFQKDL